MSRDVKEMTNEELVDEINRCFETVDFLAVEVGLGTLNSRELAEAMRTIRVAKERIRDIGQELETREGVTE